MTETIIGCLAILTGAILVGSGVGVMLLDLAVDAGKPRYDDEYDEYEDHGRRVERMRP